VLKPLQLPLQLAFFVCCSLQYYLTVGVTSWHLDCKKTKNTMPAVWTFPWGFENPCGTPANQDKPI